MTNSRTRDLKRSRMARALALCILMASAGLLGLRHVAAEAGYDLLIINGHILDGSGSPWFEGSVAVKDGKIAAVGRLPNAAAQRVIDAGGLIICPGFIDLHSHSDYTLLVDGKAESKIRQGVTTEILGESESAGPILGAAIPEFDKEMSRYGLTRDWTTLGEYLARVARQGSSVNIASYVGSGQVRMDVMGNVNRAPGPEEMERMKALVDQAMRRRPRSLLRLDLSPQLLCEYGGTDLARRSCGALWRHLYQSYARRRRALETSYRRGHRNR